MTNELLDTNHTAGLYGQHLNFWRWSTHELMQRVDLGPEGKTPMELRFLHNPLAAEGFVVCGLGSAVFRFYKTEVSCREIQSSFLEC